MKEERAEITYCYKFQCRLEESELLLDFRLLLTKEIMPFNVDSKCPDSSSIPAYSALQK
jgi:hypothetical protein